jgi:hypothetical protein
VQRGVGGGLVHRLVDPVALDREGEVRVHVHHPRRERLLAEVDELRPGRHGIALLADRLDRAPDDDDLRLLDELAGAHVEHPRGADHDRDGSGNLRRGPGYQQQEEG